MGEMMYFLRCNPQHHSLAIARGPHASLHHASFEMRGIDEYMRGTGRLLRAGVEKVWGPGRHLAGNNTFSYFLDPHGNTDRVHDRAGVRSTRTPGTRTCTTSPTRWSPTSGAPRTR